MNIENEDFRLFDKEKHKDRFEIRTKIINNPLRLNKPS